MRLVAYLPVSDAPWPDLLTGWFLTRIRPDNLHLLSLALARLIHPNQILVDDHRSWHWLEAGVLVVPGVRHHFHG